MFIKCFKNFTCYVVLISIVFSFQSSPLCSMEPNMLGEVWDYNSTNHTGRYHCPPYTPAPEDYVRSFIYPAAMTVGGFILGLTPWIYDKCKSCKKRSKDKHLDPRSQTANSLQDRLDPNDDSDVNNDSKSEDNSESLSKQFDKNSTVIKKTD